MEATFYHWLSFNLLILFILGIDLWRFYRHPHPVKVKEALVASAGWIILAFIFNAWIYYQFGYGHALDFLTGYLIEKSLSVDNLFIFLLIFNHFKVPAIAKHQVLFYGVLGAIIMRALLILGGVSLVKHFNWVFLVFGAFLIITGIRLAFKKESEKELEKNWIYQWLQKHIPFTSSYYDQAFFTQQNGKWLATPLFAVLVLIETTDLIFALDSVPAILGITTEPFIVYTSNIFAILGLRSLFFALEGGMKSFHLLHYALAFILIFIGCKMLLIDIWHIPTWATLVILTCSLSIAIVASYIWPEAAGNKE